MVINFPLLIINRIISIYLIYFTIEEIFSIIVMYYSFLDKKKNIYKEE